MTGGYPALGRWEGRGDEIDLLWDMPGYGKSSDGIVAIRSTVASRTPTYSFV